MILPQNHHQAEVHNHGNIHYKSVHHWNCFCHLFSCLKLSHVYLSLMFSLFLREKWRKLVAKSSVVRKQTYTPLINAAEKSYCAPTLLPLVMDDYKFCATELSKLIQPLPTPPPTSPRPQSHLLQKNVFG